MTLPWVPAPGDEEGLKRLRRGARSLLAAGLLTLLLKGASTPTDPSFDPLPATTVVVTPITAPPG